MRTISKASETHTHTHKIDDIIQTHIHNTVQILYEILYTPNKETMLSL